MGNNVRVFLVSEKHGEGVGLEWKRPFFSSDEVCMQTAVNYLMWEGEPENVTYCQCNDLATGAQLSSTPNPCN